MHFNSFPKRKSNNREVSTRIFLFIRWFCWIWILCYGFQWIFKVLNMCQQNFLLLFLFLNLVLKLFAQEMNRETLQASNFPISKGQKSTKPKSVAKTFPISLPFFKQNYRGKIAKEEKLENVLEKLNLCGRHKQHMFWIFPLEKLKVCCCLRL